jgi:hypothetical protein
MGRFVGKLSFFVGCAVICMVPAQRPAQPAGRTLHVSVLPLAELKTDHSINISSEILVVKYLCRL